MLLKIVLLLSLTAFFNMAVASNMAALSDDGIEQWKPKVFSGETIYTSTEYKGRSAIQALSRSSASRLVLKKKIDLIKTPYINWSWLTHKKLLQLDERSKGGDDFVARVYLVIDGALMIWKTKSLNYVWSSNQNKGLVWNNPFAGSSVKMMAVRGKETKTGKWYEERRNVFTDLIDAFGDKGSATANRKAYRYIDIIAIMTDTDNSGKNTQSYYGDIFFTAI